MLFLRAKEHSSSKKKHFLRPLEELQLDLEHKYAVLARVRTHLSRGHLEMEWIITTVTSSLFLELRPLNVRVWCGFGL